MGTVKYSGPVASFHCPTEATIRSLKVHFSPKQEGSGDPSPENIRPIEGWDGVTALKSSKNLFDTSKISCSHPSTTWNAQTEMEDMVFANGELSGTVQSGWRDTTVFTQNTPFKPGTYTLSFDYINGIKNYKWKPVIISSTYSGWYTSYKGSTIADNDNGHKEITFTADKPFYVSLNLNSFDYAATTARNKLYNIQLELGSTATPYEPCKISTTNYEFGVLGKNKFNWNVPVSESSPVASDAATARQFTLDTYVIGMSVNNYYRQNYANWVLNPSVENGVISFSSNAASGYGIAFPLKLAAGQTYFLSGTGDGIAGATYYNENGELISYQNGRLNKTIAVPENAATTLIGFYASTSNTDFTFSNIQLELGSSATAYEPYDPKHTVYGGWVDLISGEVCETHTKYVFTGEEGFYIYDSYQNKPFMISRDSRYYANMAFAASSNTNIVCNKLKGVSGRFHYLNDGCICTNTSNVYSYILMNGKEIFGETNEECNQTLADWYANGTPLEMIAPLREAYYKTYSLAPTQLQTFLGQNNVWSNADYVEVEYDLYETQTILARKQFIVANQPHVVKPAAAPLQNFVTDMAAPLKECKVHFSPVQEGTGDPSPDNVRSISGWTGFDVTKCGKNLLGGEAFKTALQNVMPVSSTSGNTVVYTNADAVSHDGDIIFDKFKSNTQYTLMLTYSKDTNLYAHIKFVYTDNSFDLMRISGLAANTKATGVFVSNANKTLAKIARAADEYSTVTMYCDECGIFEGVQDATAYEPYSGTTIPVDWTTEAGTIYGGYLDLVKGEVVEEWHKIVADGVNVKANSGYVASNGESFGAGIVYINPVGLTRNYSTAEMIRCDLLPVNSNIIPSVYIPGAGKLYVVFYLFNTTDYPNVTTNVERVEMTNAWLQEHPTTIVYKLQTPIHYSLTPQILKTLRGTNNIWSNSNGDITIQFWKH